RVQSDAFRIIDAASHPYASIVINYDKFAVDSLNAARSFTKSIGLTYHPSDVLPERNLHYLGGNVGIKGHWLGPKVRWDDNLRASVLRNGDQLRIDYDWRSALPADHIAYLVSLPYVRDLSNMLGIVL